MRRPDGRRRVLSRPGHNGAFATRSRPLPVHLSFSMSTSWFEIIIILVALACVYVSYRLCHEGYGLLRLARARFERRIALMLIVLGYMLGALLVLAAVYIASQWF